MKKKMGKGKRKQINTREDGGKYGRRKSKGEKINIKEIMLKRKEFWKLPESEGMRKIEDLGNFFT